MAKLNAYYINLQQDKKRRIFIEKQWQNINNIELIRVNATDGSKINCHNIDYYQPYKYKNSRWMLTKAEIAILDSHRRVWQKITKNQFDYAIVIEDDTIIAQGFQEIIEKIIENSSQKFDVIKLSSLDKKRTYGKNIKIEDNIVIRKIIQPTDYADCYIVTKKAAKILWQKSQNICQTADGYLFSVKKLRIFQLFEPLAEQVHIRKIRQQNLTKEQKKINLSFREETFWKNVKHQKGPILFEIKTIINYLLIRKILPILFRICGGFHGKAIMKKQS